MSFNLFSSLSINNDYFAMNWLLVVVFLSYSVSCENRDNYLKSKEQNRKPFRVYWNVPTKQCKSKRIPFNNLYQKYGFIQNIDDKFIGEEISILYVDSLFPTLHKTENGTTQFVFDGLPQEADLKEHINRFRNTLNNVIPDKQYSGLGIIDFERWRPIFRQNYGSQALHKTVSFEIEKKKNPSLTEHHLVKLVTARFEAAARDFMQSTLSVARLMRPLAVWGYYAYPYCYNMILTNRNETCARGVTAENDKLHWMWTESSALYPSVYMTKELMSNQLSSLVRGRLKETRRVKEPESLVLPYFWFKYRDESFLTKEDIEITIKTVHNLGADGFIIWGSSNDVNTVEKCKSLIEYLETILGPVVARYTKFGSDREKKVVVPVKGNRNRVALNNKDRV